MGVGMCFQLHQHRLFWPLSHKTAKMKFTNT